MEKTAVSYSLAVDRASFYAFASVYIDWRGVAMDEVGKAKRRGRPRLSDDERKRHTMTFRMRTDLRAAYAQRAENNGGSISEEIEKSLERELLFSDLISKQHVMIDQLHSQMKSQNNLLDRYFDFCENLKSVTAINIAMIDAFIRKAIEDADSDLEIMVKLGTKAEAENLLTTIKQITATQLTTDLADIHRKAQMSRPPGSVEDAPSIQRE